MTHSYKLLCERTILERLVFPHGAFVVSDPPTLPHFELDINSYFWYITRHQINDQRRSV